MKFPIIDLKDTVQAYLQKGVCKHSGEGIDPSIIIPTVQMKHSDATKFQFGILFYPESASENAFEGADGTKYTVRVNVPHAAFEGSLPEGVTGAWSCNNYTTAPFKGVGNPSLYVYEADLTVAKNFNLRFTEPFVNCKKDGETVKVSFPSFVLNLDLVTDGESGVVKRCDFPLQIGSSFKIENGELTLGNKAQSGAFLLPKSGNTTPSDENSAFAIFNGNTSAPGMPCIALHNAGANRVAGQLRIYTTKGNAYTTDLQTTDDTAALVVDGYNNKVAIGGKKTNNHSPIEVIDKLGANMAVWILGVNCEWKTITVDGVTMKVLAEKG